MAGGLPGRLPEQCGKAHRGLQNGPTSPVGNGSTDIRLRLGALGARAGECNGRDGETGDADQASGVGDLGEARGAAVPAPPPLFPASLGWLRRRARTPRPARSAKNAANRPFISVLLAQVIQVACGQVRCSAGFPRRSRTRRTAKNTAKAMPNRAAARGHEVEASASGTGGAGASFTVNSSGDRGVRRMMPVRGLPGSHCARPRVASKDRGSLVEAPNERVDAEDSTDGLGNRCDALERPALPGNSEHHGDRRTMSTGPAIRPRTAHRLGTSSDRYIR